MKAEWPPTRLGNLIGLRNAPIIIDNLHTYKRITARLQAKGIVFRDEIEGIAIKTKEQQVCRAGDFLVAEIDAKVGGFGIVPEELDGAIVSNHYFLFEVNIERLDASFLAFFIKTPAFQNQIKARGSTNYASIRPSQVLELQIPLPSIEIQRRVVLFTKSLMEKIGATELLKQESPNAICIWERILDATFEKMQAEYKDRSFRDVCEVVRGGSPRPAGSQLYYDGTIPFLKVGDLTKDESKFLTSYTWTIKEAGLSRTRLVDANTLMLTNSGATLGVPKICTFSTTFNDGIQAFLNVKSDVSIEYLYYFLRSKTKWFREVAARGQGQPNLNTDMVKDLRFPCPPVQVQVDVVKYFDDLFLEVEQLTSLTSTLEKEYRSLEPSILNELFSSC